jgi:hypothetical protein
VPRWVLKILRDWHRRKAARLKAAAEKHRRELETLRDDIEHHEYRAQHWDFVAGRRRR